MESRWYLFPGQTLENTTVSQRSHALHITKSAWGNVTKHLERKKRIQDALERDRQRKQYLEFGSKSMIEKWENSMENIRKRKEEESHKLLERKKDDKIQKFYEMRKEQEKIRKEYVDKVNKEIYMNTGNARQLTSAFVASETLYEREKQKELHATIKKHEQEEEARYAEQVKRSAEQEAAEQKEKERRQLEKERIYRENIKKEKEAKERKRMEEAAKKKQKEAMDQNLAREEFECLERKQKEDVIQKKKDLQLEERKRLKKERERQQQLEKEERELDEVVRMYQEAKHTRDCLIKERDRELKDMERARRDAVAKLVMAEQICRDEIEDRQIKKAIEERDIIEAAQLKAKQEMRQKMIQDRIDDRKKFIERRDAVNKKTEELKKWEMLNRYKADDNMRKYDEKRNKEHWEKILQYRKELLDQMDEMEFERKREKEIEQYMVKRSFVNEDEKFFAYANEILEMAKKRGRPTYPIEKVIKDYKRKNTTNAPVPDETKKFGKKKCSCSNKNTK